MEATGPEIIPHQVLQPVSGRTGTANKKRVGIKRFENGKSNNERMADGNRG
jgi:hypothetical protein